MIKIKRIYEASLPADGFRVLVDRLWPRGLSKDSAKVGVWLKEIAPSENLRKWFSHDIQKWSEFNKKYYIELREKPELVSKILELEREKKIVTLLFSAKDEKHNNAVSLLEYLQK